ncbi:MULTISPECIES: glycosyltransferase family 39 protein [unclassified Rhizobium]|uniref:glycosyltransferase family 39 protein n=1 Tax=unclassified Rhizobium TaxID=2613769 RepID=UPI0017EC7CB8|nr:MULTISPECIES: glycosyltransferase family 39 protein [unclassified Rhizobium]MBB3399143.1 4-amino-4-deoxy-L-arabinose transferase-like glycosyltransferase [Rhizobium sp. BK060]MBB4172129.1 4-amino-4-deoxy-L-arabinose transferase-like glycosyltransferase [Rhizobium sp. BK538]
MTDTADGSYVSAPRAARLDALLPVLLLATYFTASFALRLLRGGDLGSDEAEQIRLAHALQLGYGDQPPLYNWLFYCFGKVFGVSVDTLAFLKNATLLVSCIFLGLAARKVVGARDTAWISVLGLLSLPAIFLLSQRDLTHSVGAFAAVAFFLYVLALMAERPSTGNYALLGAAAGVGLLAKYNFAIIPVATVVALLLEPGMRRLVLNWRLAVTIAIGLAVAGPHVYWVMTHLDTATGDTLTKMRGVATHEAPVQLVAAWQLLASIVKCSALTLAILAVVYRGHIRTILTASSEWTRVIGRMLLICMFLVFVIMLAVDATMMRPKWITIFFVAFPLYLAFKVDAAGIQVPGATRKLVALVGAVIFISLGVVFAESFH